MKTKRAWADLDSVVTCNNKWERVSVKNQSTRYVVVVVVKRSRSSMTSLKLCGSNLDRTRMTMLDNYETRLPFFFFFSPTIISENIGEKKRPIPKGKRWRMGKRDWALCDAFLKGEKERSGVFRGNPEWRRVAFLDGMTSSRLKWDAADKPPAKLGEQLSL